MAGRTSRIKAYLSRIYESLVYKKEKYYNILKRIIKAIKRNIIL
jgi:hypothetical protein